MNEPGKSKEVTTKQVRAVRFSVYTEEEVRKLSVVRILQPITRNALKEPVPQGLYDTAMGPVDKSSTMMHRLVRCTCLFCFHLKLQQPQVEKYESRFKQLAFGDLAAGIETHVAKTFTNKTLVGLLDHDMDPKEFAARSHAAPVFKKNSKVSFTQHALEATQDTLVSFWAQCSTKAKCANCGAINPNIRKFGTRLFMVWTSPKALVTNAMNNHVMPNLLEEGASVVANMEAEVAADISRQASARANIRERKKRGLPVDHDSKKHSAGDEESADQVDKLMEEVMKDEEDEEGLKDEEDDEDDEMGIKAGVAQMEIDKAEDTLARMVDQEEGTKKRGRKSVKDAAYDAAARVALASPTGPKFITSSEVMAILKRLWQHEAPVLNLIFAASSPSALGLGAGQVSAVPAVDLAASTTYRMFFLSVLSVSPNKFRPPSKLGEDEFEHIQNASYIKILNACLDINTTVSTQAAAYASARLASEQLDPASLALATAKQDLSRVVGRWLELQNCVCELMDTSTTEKKTEALGIRQQIEKKEGLFRKNMMGKRVNFAARSVISPDPYIGTGEIGVPPYFAKRLTFAERVTPFNVERLRKAVINGHSVHPGALSVEMENGTVTHLEKLSKPKREALAKQLLATSTGGVMTGRQRLLGLSAAAAGKQVATSASAPQTSKIVYRHLQDGDVMLTNRQPTLHKPGLMAHRARVLKGEKTIRMHYANCATFNADFDGDEINLHLPQDQMGRAEGYEIVHADQQFIVPTDGKPIRGLIQDHVVSGTLLAKRDTFFTRQEYSQLLFVGCTVWTSKAQGGTSQAAMQLDPPTILKPQQMWTGKQVIAGVIRFFTRHAGEPLTFIAGSKVPAAYWGLHSGEDELELLNGYLLRGCIDKNQFGKYGLVHAVQELYGGTAAGQLLSAFSRLFTYYLSWHGFTCGFDDLLLVRDAELMRAKMLEKAETIALKASADFVGQPLSRYVLEKATEGGARAVANPEVVAASQEISTALAMRYRNAEETGKAHDIKGSGVMHPLSSEVIKSCLPNGQVKAFPANCLSLMTISGAKGSLVNFSQISCLLGQQELEGRRVPRMSSGKTLPCFRAFDGGARSCGFVGDRFLTGLRPQEYYFHCMAGREGLVDTTVKTSRSGYLQRCMIKNLESLRVHYDNTVRDNADGSVVQMFYGEDGVDVMNINYMQKFEFLAKNAVTFARRLDLPNALLAGKTACLEDAEAQIAAAITERTVLKAKAVKAQKDGKLKLAAKTIKQLGLNPPVSALQPPTVMGATSEKFADSLAKFVHDNAGGLLASEDSLKAILSRPTVPGRQGVFPVKTNTFQQLMHLKFMRSLAAPGEAVGVIAAQSVGEPSTQMTLNTFHMAGRGEANVTLGIPRLREILMAAAKKIRTPVMTVPLLPGLGVQAAGVLAGRMRKLRLAECVSGISVEETPVAALDLAGGGYGRKYRVTLHFYSEDKYPVEVNLTHTELATCFMKEFCPALQKEIDKESKKKGSVAIGKVDVADLDDELQLPDGEADDEEAAAVAASKSNKKKKTSKDDAFEDFEGDEELREGKLRFRGGRGESASYAPADEEDEQDNKIAAQEEKQRQAAAGAAARGEEPAVEESAEGCEEADEEEEGKTTAAAAKGKQSGSKRGSSAKDGKRRKVTPKTKVEAPKTVFDLDMKLSGYEGDDGDTHMSSDSDPYAEQSCSVTLTMPLSSPKLLMLELVEKIASETTVRSTKGIERVYVIEPNSTEAAKCQTDGITFPGVWAHSDIVNVNGITTNDVHAMLTTYGVEAARGTLMHEVQSVFAAYGIGVDPRHLSLIADFMTHQGGYRACNRIGISSCISPLLKMSFETAAAFLTDATLKGSVDDLRSPAARLVVGRVVELGTGVMDLLHVC